MLQEQRCADAAAEHGGIDNFISNVGDGRADMTDTTHILLELEAIRQLKTRYFRCVDAKDWDEYRAVFADDVVFDISDDMPETGLTHGADAAVALARAGLGADVTSVHHGHCPEIRLTSDDSAQGIWAMEDMLFWAPGAASPIRSLHGYGHYHETYRRIDGAWKIQTMTLKRIRVDTWGWD